MNLNFKFLKICRPKMKDKSDYLHRKKKINAGNITTTKDTTTVGSVTSNSLLRTGHCMNERRKDGG